MSDSFISGKPQVFRSILFVLAVSLICGAAFAQSDSNPKYDVFIGYQWLHPGATVPAPYSDPNAPIELTLPDSAKGAGAALTFNFDPHWGMEFDFGDNWGSSNNLIYESTVSLGPRFIWRTDEGNYFLHSLLSWNRAKINSLNSPNGIGAILGGGWDLPITKKFAWRVFEADYVWARHNYADFAAPEFPDLRRPSYDGIRLRTGIVVSWGGAPPVAPSASCTVQPTEVMVGEPLTATVSASNFNPKHTVTYTWSGNGGVVTGKDTTAQIDTTNAAPGSYTVTAHVTDAKEKENNEASCTANFTVKPLPPKNPPTISISANPTTVTAGEPVNLSATCSSPDGVGTSVANWTASGGNISGSGTSASLNTAGVAPGTITVGATCTDTRGLSTQASTQVAVQAPPPPPPNPEIVRLEARLALHSIYFVTNLPTVTNPKGGLLPSQQKTLVVLATDFKEYLQSKPDAHLILGGHADHRGSVEFNQKLSERRVERVRAFLIEQGVPEADIEIKAYGKEDNLTDEQVTAEVESNPELTPEERQRVLKNMVVIRMASNRRVDVTLSTTGQTSVRQFPFNTTDALTLIGGREGEAKKPVRKPVGKKPATKPSNQQ
jgi:outer membrane protein OmpA-like peptidoglycan-associated protein